MSEELELSVDTWDAYAQQTYVKTRTGSSLKDQILQQWATRDKFINENPTVALHQQLLTDKFTTDDWALSLLSSEAPAGNFGSHERICEALEESASQSVQEARKALLDSAKSIRQTLVLLVTFTEKPIDATDFRFTRITRTNHEIARTNFKFGVHYKQLPVVINILEEIERILNDKDDDTDLIKTLAETARDYIDSVAKAEAALILSATISTSEFVAQVANFNKAVKENSEPYLLQQYDEAKQHLAKLKYAHWARTLCKQLLPGLVLDCDNSYSAHWKNLIAARA